jgi:hypothetical protein
MSGHIAAFTLTVALVLTPLFIPGGVAVAQNAPTSPLRIAPDPASGSSGAVVVGDVPLLYTEQILPAPPHPEALVALDAIATMNRTPGQDRYAGVPPGKGIPRAPLSIQPAGRRVYISGQAEAAPDMAEATTKTMRCRSKSN